MDANMERELDEMATRIAARFKLVMAALPPDDPAHMKLSDRERLEAEEVLSLSLSPELLEAVGAVWNETTGKRLGSATAEQVIDGLKQRGYEIRRVG